MDPTSYNRIEKLLETNSNPAQDSERGSGYDFSKETILITGAAGTVGSSLSKLLLNSRFKALVLLDNAETPLYYLQKELEPFCPKNVFIALADIRDELSMRNVFEEFKPTLIFHAAAYKHVPMMESNPYEAVKLNIFGTLLLAELALKHNVKKVVFISTDKAVNPSSVMGMTKRIGERFLNHLNTQNKTRFLAVRFGNIIESNGSLIPLFKKQIEQGNPLSITDENVTRYFISKLKACHLILKIATNSTWEHSLFSFDMGKPIKILDMAHYFLKLHNLDVHDNIKTIGLRPGEKLHEDIISENEALKPSAYNDIFYVIPKSSQTLTVSDLEPLRAITPYDKPSTIKDILKGFI